MGGGGGAGGSSFNLSAAVGANSVDAGVNLGGSGGGGGDAGSVTVNNSGSIRTGAVTSKDGTYKVSGLNSFWYLCSICWRWRWSRWFSHLRFTVTFNWEQC